MMEEIDEFIEKSQNDHCRKESLEKCLTGSLTDEDEMNDEEVNEMIREFNSLPKYKLRYSRSIP